MTRKVFRTIGFTAAIFAIGSPILLLYGGYAAGFIAYILQTEGFMPFLIFALIVVIRLQFPVPSQLGRYIWSFLYLFFMCSLVFWMTMDFDISWLPYPTTYVLGAALAFLIAWISRKIFPPTNETL